MPINKQYYGYEDIHNMVTKICLQMYKDEWRPDYIVGLTRGGLVPAVIMSNMLDIPMHTLKVNLRDHVEGSESNLWMAEDAFGYIPESERRADGTRWDPDRRKKILIIDDINDTGATLNWIVNDWQSSCLPSNPVWENIWCNDVRFAVLIDNLSSDFKYTVNYSCDVVNKAEEDVWIVYPWES